MDKPLPPLSQKRPSRYAQLEGTTVASLDDSRRERLTQVTDETGQDGNRMLTIHFPTPRSRNPVQILDASNWLVAPELAKAFADMVVIWGGDKTERTRQSFVEVMGNGFFKYLSIRQDETPIGLADLSTGLVNGFINWLDRRENGALVLASYTRLHYLGVLRTAIDYLKKTVRYASILPSDLHIRRIPWPGVSRQVNNPTEILPRPVWEALYQVCVNECMLTMAKLELGWALIEQGKAAGHADDAASLHLGHCLTRLDAACPGVIPSRREIHRVDSGLLSVVMEHHALADIILYFQPTPRSLVPFVLLLGMATFFSGDTLLGTLRSDLSQSEVLGAKRLVWRPYKARSHRRQHRSFPMADAPDSPSVIVPFIERWTARIRHKAAPRVQERLFLWVSISGTRRPATFGTANESSYGGWQINLDEFLAEHGLPHLTLRKIRATGLEIVHDLFAGDLRAVQAVGGQQRPEVILSHYTSDAARKRNDERLGDVMALRGRWRETNGVLDARGLPSGQDVAAATPGWRCFDPYDSPILGQEKGKLCAAYGACPNCPLAQLNGQDAYSLARSLQLRAKIGAAQGSMPAERWLKTWAPRLQRLVDYWLPQFQDAAIIDAAARLDLEDLPDLE